VSEAKWQRRERKQLKARYGMVVTNRSIKSVLLVQLGKPKKGKRK